MPIEVILALFEVISSKLILDTFIVVDKLKVSFPITKLLSVFEYSVDSIVQELFELDIEMLVPRMIVILSCLLLDNLKHLYI